MVFRVFTSFQGFRKVFRACGGFGVYGCRSSFAALWFRILGFQVCFGLRVLGGLRGLRVWAFQTFGALGVLGGQWGFEGLWGFRGFGGFQGFRGRFWSVLGLRFLGVSGVLVVFRGLFWGSRALGWLQDFGGFRALECLGVSGFRSLFQDHRGLGLEV